MTKPSHPENPSPLLVAADGYAAMFQDAPPPTADDLRALRSTPIHGRDWMSPQAEAPAVDLSL